MWLVKFVLFCTFFAEIFTCEEDTFQVVTPIQRPYWKYYPNRGNVWVTTQNVTHNVTIICKNVSSIRHIVYNYSEKPYNQTLKIVNSTVSAIRPNELSSFSTIIALHLKNLQIESILPGAFNGLTRLKELYLNDNKLLEIVNGVLNSLHRLEVLDLRNNQIWRFDTHSLMGAANLRNLFLNQNNLSVIEDGVFENLSHLTYVDVSENPLEKFPFNDLTNVKTLIVAKTELTSMENDFSNLTMKLLNVSHNQIQQVDFSYLPTLEIVDISNNEITTVENGKNFDAVEVKLDHNKIANIDEMFKRVTQLSISHNELEELEVMFNGSETLIYLDFSYNRISKIDKTFFHGMKNLRSLYLQSNKISEIDTVLFRDLSNLVILDLSQNQIKQFQYGALDSMVNLATLNISSNKLLDLHQYTFNSLNSLSGLYFDNNRISSFDVTDLSTHLPRLRTISLNHNAWRCRDLVKIQQVCQKHRINILPGLSYEVENFRGIACSNSNEFVPDSNVSIIYAKEVAQNIQKGIDMGMENSKMERFFNDEFGQSKLVQYFDKDYSQSSFFKFLNNYKFTIVTQHLNDTSVGKFTELQVNPSETNDKILIFGVVLLSIVVVLLILMFCMVSNYLYKLKFHSSSQMELC
ncbi:hypothetical protein Zmor_018331 [Zophobas morio]|uniref:Uncharacterized protein n=1 Tax=Zophobas morio TaxID=2755281 RepID=A0AA38MDF9_9CUCU|nr:hypothetical protein Zmor_018331 [Zophobas morio]